ncbi:transcription elongation factor spt4 [Aulographum hederae CBS 113979]|uniref:Transcription elongation factor SPT4 n=1 Tax=Aulographum hederae CBS 113979 TaxID=1176131 RepID=A0A6G1HAP8_9PEZI|nr:transcription elongation factor spt4 [Aulographum hederae CBS 113979]
MSTRSLRACLLCSVVQAESVFKQQGCPNCESILSLQGNIENIRDCTSTVFEGLIALNDPNGSWVAKWQRLDSYSPGMYAMKVVGVLPDEILKTVEEEGITYVPRDGTGGEEVA